MKNRCMSSSKTLFVYLLSASAQHSSLTSPSETPEGGIQLLDKRKELSAIIKHSCYAMNLLVGY